MVKLTDAECENRAFEPGDMTLEGTGTHVTLKVEQEIQPPKPNPTAGVKNARIMQITASPILKAQREDEQCDHLMHILTGGRLANRDLTDRQKKKLTQLAKELVIEEGMLMHHLKDDFTGAVRSVPFVPMSMRQKVISAMHDDPAAGHQGELKTLHRVKQRFWWPTMRLDVKTDRKSVV